MARGSSTQLNGMIVSVGLGFLAWSAVAAYSPVWLSEQLHLSSGQLAGAFVLASAGGMLGSLLGAKVVAGLGARRAVVGAAACQALVALLVFRPHESPVEAIAVLFCVTLLQPIRGVAQRWTVTQVWSETTRETAFVSFRSAMNIGIVAGPLAMALLLLPGWHLASVGAACAFAAAALGGLLIPRIEGERPVRRKLLPLRGEFFSDRGLLQLVLTSIGAWTLVSGLEVVLPAALTTEGKISPTAWGIGYAVASGLVAISQVPLGRLLIRRSMSHRLVLGTLALGVALVPGFMLPGAFALVMSLLLLAAGELFWGPPSEELTVRVSPPGRDAIYISAVSLSLWAGEGLAGGVGFPLLQRIGPPASAAVFVVIAAATSVGYVTLARKPRTHPAPEAFLS